MPCPLKLAAESPARGASWSTPRGPAAEERDTTMQYGVEEGAKAGFARVDALLEKIAT